MSVFWPDGRVVESGRYALSFKDLTFVILEYKSFGPLKYAERAALKARRVTSGFETEPSGFDAAHGNAFVIFERMEQTDRIAATADAGDELIGQTIFTFKDLRSGLASDDRLKVSHHRRVGVRAEG